MPIIANRVRNKQYSIELKKFVLLFLKKFCKIFPVSACLYLLYFPIPSLSKLSLETYGAILSVESLVSENFIKSIKLIHDQFPYFRKLEVENIKLRLQLSHISNEDKVITATISENRELKKLLKVVDNLQCDYITSRLLGISNTPFSSSAIVEVGSNNKVKVNDLIINQDGLLGKVINVSNNYSSIMLLQDPNSRVPVLTSSSRERGILAKKGNDMLLIYLTEEHNIKIGELLYTSGDGKIYPYGILVGRVKKIKDNSVFIELSANLKKAEFVTITLKS